MIKVPKMPAPIFVDSGAVYTYSPAMAKKWTFLSRFDNPFTGYYEEGGYIRIPREFAPKCTDDRRSTGKKVAFDINFKPRNHEQERVIKESVTLLSNDKSHILQAPTGFGKTVVGSVIIGKAGTTTLIIVPKNDIIPQWHNSLKTFLGLKDHEIGRLQGTICDVKNKKVVIGMVHSLCKPGRYPDWVYKYFGLVVTDETHVMGAETFNDAMWLFNSKLRLGLSATPYRKDGKDMLFLGHIGPILVKAHTMALRPKVIRAASPWKCPVTKKKNKFGEWVIVKMPHNAGKTMHINKMLAKNHARNMMIIDFVWAAYQKNRNTVVFSELKGFHLDRLYELLVARGIPTKDIGYYIGGMKPAEMEKSKAKPIVLATYGMCAMATDVPWWDTCVLGTPRSDVIQIVGRILREYEGKISCEDEGKKEGVVPVVFDIVDTDSPVFSDYADKRAWWYRKIQAKVIRKS